MSEKAYRGLTRALLRHLLVVRHGGGLESLHDTTLHSTSRDFALFHVVLPTLLNKLDRGHGQLGIASPCPPPPCLPLSLTTG